MSDIAEGAPKRLGYWTCWSLTVGIMIGSGIFLLPATLAPYGLMSFGGWIMTAGGSVLLALVFASLASRTSKSGGVYTYARTAFGDLIGFLVAWGYWASYWIALPAIALAFVGYLGEFVPGLEGNAFAQALSALGLIWLVTLINIKGVKEAGLVQIALTGLKLVPLLIIIVAALLFGSTENFPELHPKGGSHIGVIATTALLTMWAFSGLEAGTMPAGEVDRPESTIPKAIVGGTLMVALIYIGTVAAVMALVPSEQLAASERPFAYAARQLGPWGPDLISIGALIATAGALNGVAFISGQISMVVAQDGLAPRFLSRPSQGGASIASMLLAAILASLLLLANYTRGLIGLFEFLIMMSTLALLLPLLVCAVAELWHNWQSIRSWSTVAILASLYSVFAIFGSGLTVLLWGLVLFLVGLAAYFCFRSTRSQPQPEEG